MQTRSFLILTKNKKQKSIDPVFMCQHAQRRPRLLLRPQLENYTKGQNGHLGIHNDRCLPDRITAVCRTCWCWSELDLQKLQGSKCENRYSRHVINKKFMLYFSAWVCARAAFRMTTKHSLKEKEKEEKRSSFTITSTAWAKTNAR